LPQELTVQLATLEELPARLMPLVVPMYLTPCPLELTGTSSKQARGWLAV
jgi:hypothetical protein